MNLCPIVTYQGGKQKLAKSIIDTIESVSNIDYSDEFWDVCCGSGAISTELLNRGYTNIHMVDIGPFGVMWEMIGNNSFSLADFSYELNMVPKNKEHIKPYMEKIANDKEFNIYRFLILQAGSFGGKAISWNGDSYDTASFRNYWKPTPTSSRRYPVNPMMPMPETMLQRARDLSQHGDKITGYHCDASNIIELVHKNIYIDPPYQDSYGYADRIDIKSFVSCISAENVFVSDSVRHSSNFWEFGRNKKGGINGNRGIPHNEFLSKI